MDKGDGASPSLSLFLCLLLFAIYYISQSRALLNAHEGATERKSRGFATSSSGMTVEPKPRLWHRMRETLEN
jgi:hypothetical protein